jgi:two-component system, LytTR family, response regulator
MRTKHSNALEPNTEKLKRLALKTPAHFIVVEPSNILYCEGDSNYTTFFLYNNQRIMIAKTLKDVEHLLLNHDFFRIHASYLINLNHVSKFTRGNKAHVVMDNNQCISVSRKKKEEFFKMFSKL